MLVRFATTTNLKFQKHFLLVSFRHPQILTIILFCLGYFVAMLEQLLMFCRILFLQARSSNAVPAILLLLNDLDVAGLRTVISEAESKLKTLERTGIVESKELISD